MGKETTEFTIRFSGSKNRIDAELLGEELINTSALLNEINKKQHPENVFNVEVCETRKGSFDIVCVINAFADFFNSNPELIAHTYTQIISLAHLLHGKKPKKIDEKEKVYVLQLENGSVIEVDKEVFDEFRKEADIRELLAAKFRNLKKIESATNYEIFTEGKKTLAIPFSNIKDEEYPVEFDEFDNVEIQKSNVSNTRLFIERISFNDKYKHNVTYNGFSTSAIIEDQEFWRKVDNGEISFRHGDTLVADIYYEVHTTPKKQTNKNFKITKVHRVLPSSIIVHPEEFNFDN